MKTKYLLLTLLFILAGTVSIQSARKNSDGRAEALFREKSFDFGNVPELGGKVTHEFEFVNSGNANLMIVDATAECGCTTPEYPKEPIQPGRKGVIKVSFSPKGRPGMFNKTVTVRTNGEPRKIRLKIKGRVTSGN